MILIVSFNQILLLIIKPLVALKVNKKDHNQAEGFLSLFTLPMLLFNGD